VASLSPRIVFIRDLLRAPEVQATWLVPHAGASQLRDSTGFKPASLSSGHPHQRKRARQW
jgi:hypothetical protein